MFCVLSGYGQSGVATRGDTGEDQKQINKFTHRSCRRGHCMLHRVTGEVPDSDQVVEDRKEGKH